VATAAGNLCASQPCLNGGSCRRLGSINYFCSCEDGFSGRNCETSLFYESPCDISASCANGGTCLDIGTGRDAFVCVCRGGFTGMQCDQSLGLSALASANQPFPSCNDNGACLNGGVCFFYAGFVFCDCPSGFTGRHCENSLGDDVCAGAPCLNGGKCIPVRSAVPSYMCNCAPGFTGANCQTISRTTCTNSACKNGATCLNFQNNILCVCPRGFFGSDCGTDHCSSNPCLNGGRCVLLENTFACDCPAGHIGRVCDTAMNHCAPDPCMHRGVCYNEGSSYRCACQAGFTGQSCENFASVAQQSRQQTSGQGCPERTTVPNNVAERISYPGNRPPPGVYPAFTRISYGCKQGFYELLGPSDVMCNADGRWSAGDVKCVPECGVVASNVRETVVGGNSTRRCHFPWQVVIYKRGVFHCGGTLLDDSWVLTAAHCGFEANGDRVVALRPSDLDIGIGKRFSSRRQTEQYAQFRQVRRIIVHPAYSQFTLENDMALLKLQTPVEIGVCVRPVCLPNGNIPRPATGEHLIVTGYGSTGTGEPSSDVLLQAQLPIVSSIECEQLFHATGLPELRINDDFRFCAGYSAKGVADSCNGDSGGPFVKAYGNRFVIHGVVSAGGSLGCAAGQYTTYTRVSGFLDFIINTMSRSG
ncbi:PREDICTED: neurogenic locus notch homolog protein 2-like, partial [Priapulus caudatus]|uniref:Neurogenic locus notch homolog protein 2-like n=1 Tax=Priapulus caudatus TaxID=37621 RepID=A0ABM1EPI4_PRICU